MRSVTVQAPAKLNLALDITGIADKGYHLLDMVLTAVNLYETITVRPSCNLILRLPNSSVPVNEHNTAYKAALSFFDYTGLLTGADITVRKTVPIRAGMAGGSADAAGVLVALNRLYGARMSMDELCRVGLKVGADVPFCIQGGAARVRGVGEVISPISASLRCWMCVCMPKTGVSTRDAYAGYDERGAVRHPDCAAIETAIIKGDLPQIAANMYNVLEESSTSKYNSSIRAILDANGALASMMTGSGAAVFGVFRDKKAAMRAKAALLGEYDKVWVLHPVGSGVRILE